MELLQKWVSRKLLVAILTVIAIAWGTQYGEEAGEKVVTTGTIIVNAIIAILGSVYIIAQGLVDKKDTENNGAVH